MRPAHICHRCLQEHRAACAGPCPCPIDGRDVLVHIATRECPRGLFIDLDEAPPEPATIPRDQWPMAARIVAKLATPADVGVGDTLARTIDPLGGDIFKRWYKRITGAKCGCQNRQGSLNAMYPYSA